MRLFFLLLLLSPPEIRSQNTIGLPDVINYHKSEYKAGTQTWDIKQDGLGIMYFANNEGLLSFDGRYWNLHPLPNRTIVRSLEINKENRIYVGGQDELGYFYPGESGKLDYKSLLPSIPGKERSFGDVWDILTFQSSVFFRTNNKIFKYAGRTIEVYNSPTEWMFMGTVNGRLFAQDSRYGLLQYENERWVPLPTKNKLPDHDPVTSITTFDKDTLLVTTLKNGIYKFTMEGFTKVNQPDLLFLEQQRIYSAIKLSNDWLAIATSIGGLFITDKSGNIIQHFSKAEGLQNNNVLTVALDQQNNLWLGLDNGIDCIAYSSAVKHIHTGQQDGSGYAALIHDNKLYLGTSTGLYYAPLSNNEDISYTKGGFSPVEKSTGQTWSLASINGSLLMGHHEGAFLIEKNKANQFAYGTGFWNFIPISNVLPGNQIIAGNYKGISLFNHNENKFTLSSNIAGFGESSRYVETDQSGNIWVSHPYHGVFKISRSVNGEFTHRLYTDKDGLPDLLNNQVFKLKNEIVFATERGIYYFNEADKRFEKHADYEKVLGQQSLRYLKEDKEGNIWFIHDKSLGVVEMNGRSTEVNYITELNNKLLSGFEMIYPVNASNVFIGGEDGFYHINYQKYKANQKTLIVRLREVNISNGRDSLLFGGYNSDIQKGGDQEFIPEINHSWKNIAFKFSVPYYGQLSKMEFSCRLKGFEDNWSEWTEKNEKEYTNLPAGRFVFEIKARNNIGQESAAVSYSFIILPPWYRTPLAYLCYLFLILTTAVMLIKRQRKKLINQRDRYEEEQRKLQALHQLEINKAENELMALRNEKLQSDIDFKNSELATTAMHLVQKGELISKIKSDLNQIMRELDNEKAINEIKKMMKMLSNNEKVDKDWEHFTQHFDKVHSDFVVALKEKHGNLSSNETKLCTYLRMNLSTKEIAQLLNISARGVEISRYRLRKKLGIATEISLFDYLINLNTKGSSLKQDQNRNA